MTRAEWKTVSGRERAAARRYGQEHPWPQHPTADGRCRSMTWRKYMITLGQGEPFKLSILGAIIRTEAPREKVLWAARVSRNDWRLAGPIGVLP